MRNLMHLEPLPLCVALGPLAVYLLLLGVVNLARRPFLTTGARDVAALGVALSGFVVVGPLELFQPETAAVHFGGYVWLLMLALYVLAVTLVALLLRPSLMIYNVEADQLRPILANVVAELDDTARWAGDNLYLPQWGVQLHLDPFAGMKNVRLVASGARQSYRGWRRLEQVLLPALREARTMPNRYGISLILFGLLMVGMVAYAAVHDTPAIAHALREMLLL